MNLQGCKDKKHSEVNLDYEVREVHSKYLSNQAET